MASALPKSLTKLLPPMTVDATTTINPHPTTLYRALSRLPRDGIGARLAQCRWDAKGIHGSYWEITRTKLKLDGTHGKAWGRLVWKGKPVSERDELIRGGLKYTWKLAKASGAVETGMS